MLPAVSSRRFCAAVSGPNACSTIAQTPYPCPWALLAAGMVSPQAPAVGSQAALRAQQAHHMNPVAAAAAAVAAAGQGQKTPLAQQPDWAARLEADGQGTLSGFAATSGEITAMINNLDPSDAKR